MSCCLFDKLWPHTGRGENRHMDSHLCCIVTSVITFMRVKGRCRRRQEVAQRLGSKGKWNDQQYHLQRTERGMDLKSQTNKKSGYF